MTANLVAELEAARTRAERLFLKLNHAEARLVAAERVVEAARQAQSFMPATCEHAEAFARHPDNIWCAARHRHVIVDALIAYEKAYSVASEKNDAD